MNFQKNFLHSKPHTLNTNRGQVAIIATLFFVGITLVVSLGSSGAALKEELSSRSAVSGKGGYFLSEAGQEDVVYRIFSGKPVGNNVILSFGENIATTTIAAPAPDQKEVTSLGGVGKNMRKTFVSLLVGEGTSFVYGVQVGDGGLLMENTSSVFGNVFSNGPVEGRNSNIVRGEAISAGPAGRIDGVHATSSAYAHTIVDSFIEGDAYYQTISGSTVLGTLHPGSPDQAPRNLPITDEMIEGWKTVAEAAHVISGPCPYKIKNNTTIGPAKITCDVEISGSPTVTLAGNLWVVGNLDIKNSPTIQASTALGNKSVVVVADNPSNRLTSSKIEIENSSEFLGSGQPGSYIVFVSQNNSAEQGGGEAAIEIGNTARGEIILFSGHGEILLQNSVDLREVTGYKVHLKNSAAVNYNMGLQSVLFSTGPSGGYQIIDWKEIK